MSFYEGKNCFRNAFVQRPVYSGHCNISAAKINFPILTTAVDASSNNNTTTSDSNNRVQVELVVTAHGPTLNVLHRHSGQLLCTRDVGLDGDDIILHIDTVTVAAPGAAGAAAASQPLGADVDAEESSRGEVLLYIAASTRSLQICVLALRAVATLADEKRLTARRLLRLQERDRMQQRFTTVHIDVPARMLSAPGNSNSNGNGEQLQQKLTVPLAVALTTVKQWTADQSAVSCLKFSPLTYHLASGSADAGLKVWSVLNHFLTHQFRGTGGVVTALSYLDEDESLLAAGTFEGYLSVIDFAAKKVLASGRKHTASVEAMSLTGRNSNGNIDAESEILLISASRDRTVTVFEAKSLRQLRAVALGHPLLACCFVSPFVGVYGCDNGLVGAFSVSPQTFGTVVFAVRDAPKTGAEEEHSVRSIAFIRNEHIAQQIQQQQAQDEEATKKAAAASPALGSSSSSPSPSASRRRQRATAAESAGGKNEQKAPAAATTTVHSLLPETVLIADASYRLFSFSAHLPASAAGKGPGTLSAPTGAKLRLDQTDVLNLDQIMDAKFFPFFGLAGDQSRRAAANNSNNSDAANGSNQGRGNSEEIVIATNARDCYVTAGANSSRLRGALTGHSDIIVSVDIDAAGARILTASKDMTCRVWSADTLQCVGVSLAGVHSAELTAARFVSAGNNTSQNGLDLACTTSFDSVLAIWDLASTTAKAESAANSNNTLTCVSSVAGVHDGPTYCVAVAPNGQFIATGGKDKTVGLFAVRGRRIAREEGGTLRGHRRTVSCLAFSPVDRLLVSGSNDGAVRVWALATMSCVRTMQADTIPVLQLAFFNRGTQLVTANADGVTRFWATAAGECVAVSSPHGDRAWALCVREHEEERSADLFASDDDDDDEAEDENAEGEDAAEQDEEEDNDVAAASNKATKKQAAAAGSKKTVSRIFILTGSADGTLVCQEDFTDERVELMRQERVETAQKEQQLRNTMREGDYGAAFALALTLNHPRHLRSVIVEWMGKTASALSAAAKLRRKQREMAARGGEDSDEDNNNDGNAALDELEVLLGLTGDDDGAAAEKKLLGDDTNSKANTDGGDDDDDDPCERQVSQIVATLSNNQLHRLFSFARLWLTNAKHCGAASLVVSAALRGLHPVKLEGLAAFAEVAEALLAYSKRHLARLRRSQDQLHYIEYLTKGSVFDEQPAQQQQQASASASTKNQEPLLAAVEEDTARAPAAAAAVSSAAATTAASSKKRAAAKR